MMSNLILSVRAGMGWYILYIKKVTMESSWSLKVPSVQIKSAREWYYWIGIDKGINRYRLCWSLIFDFKVLSRFIQKCLQPPASSAYGVCIESFLPIGWDTSLRKKSAKGLHYFGLDCGMLEWRIFYSQAVLQRTMVDSPAFLGFGLAEKIVVCAHTTCLPKK